MDNTFVKKVLQLSQNQDEVGIKETGVKNPIYYAIEYSDKRMVFGKSNAKINEYQTLKRFKDLKKVSIENAVNVIIFKSELEFDENRRIYNSLGIKKK